jgi:ASCH domain
MNAAVSVQPHVVALSLKQPWAWVVLHLQKHVENRRWPTAFRGDFLLHASKTMTRDDYYGCLEFCTGVIGSHAIRDFPPLKALPRGVIVGAARLVDVLPPCSACSKKCWSEYGGTCGAPHGWHMPEQYGFVLEHVRPAPRLVPCVGHLGFFPVGDQVLQALRGAA